MGDVMKKTCPKCKSKNVRKIMYGYPSYEAFEKAEAGKIVLGGCCISPDNPDYGCLDCKHQWLSIDNFGDLKIKSNNKTLKYWMM